MAISGLEYLLTLPKFEHLEAKTVEEACSLLSKYKGKARLIAGGTDLLVSMKKREIAPEYLINLKTIPSLNYISYIGEEYSDVSGGYYQQKFEWKVNLDTNEVTPLVFGEELPTGFP